MTAFVLMGSGEFLPWAREVDRWAIDTSALTTDRVVVVPTASAPEGDDVFARWARMGVEHFEALGLRPEVLEVRTRADAERVENARTVEGARYIFFSGGNPAYLAETFAGTATWRGVLDALAEGASYGGCSAGIVALGGLTLDSARIESGGLDAEGIWRPGLGLFADAFLAAHWDALDGYLPGLTRYVLDHWPAGSVLFALDEETAALGDGETWRVEGKGGLTIPGSEDLERITADRTCTVPLGLNLGEGALQA